MERGEQQPPSVLLAATRLLYHMGNIFWDNAPGYVNSRWHPH